MTILKRHPYLIPTADHINVGRWYLLKADGESEILGDLLPYWDPALNIRATVDISLNLPKLYEDCNLNEAAILRLSTIWESSGTVLKGHGEHVDLNIDSASKIRLGINLDSINIARELKLIVNLVFLNAGGDPKPFSPKIAGSILIQEQQDILIEGEGARFPIEVVHFSKSHYPNNAGWVLEWDPSNLDQNILSDVRLLINAEHERVVNAISGDIPEDEDLREAIRFDLAKTLIYGALMNQEFLEDADSYMEGTIGASIRNMLRLYFPGQSFAQLKINSQTPSSFEPKLQDSLRIFWRD